MLEVKDLSFSYGKSAVFRNVSFSCETGSITTVIGTNGSGKTTLLKCIAALAKEQSGEVLLNGARKNTMSRRSIASKVGYLDQNNYCAARLNVFEVILLGRIRELSFQVPDEELRRVEEISALLGIKEHLNKEIADLSGGQRQMVFIAQTLIKEPEILLMDEPTSALDVKHQFHMMNLIRQFTAEKSLTTVIALHHLDLVARYSDQVIVMHDKSLHAAGSPKEIITERLLSEVYGVESDIYLDEYGYNHAVIKKEL